MDLRNLFFDNTPLQIQIGGKVLSYDEKNYDNGILRIGEKDNFNYIYTLNKKEVSKSDNERIKNLKIPPMWKYVWITKDPNSAIQVIGIDNSGKKQYLYTQKHKDISSVNKFKNLELFIKLLPKLNHLIKENSKLNVYDKKRVLATMVKIILLSGIRAGKEFYVKKNKSYGICSLRKKHVKLKDGKVYLNFKGKSGIVHNHIIHDTDVYEHIEQLMKLKSSETKDNDKIFLYIDKKTKKITKIDEHMLNKYLHKYLDKDIVIKDLRTYLVNYLIVKNLLEITNKIKKNNAKKNINKVILKTANFIQHTPAICKKSYIHPFIIHEYTDNIDYFIKNKDKEPIKVLIDLLEKSHNKN